MSLYEITENPCSTAFYYSDQPVDYPGNSSHYSDGIGYYPYYLLTILTVLAILPILVTFLTFLVIILIFPMTALIF